MTNTKGREVIVILDDEDDAAFIDMADKIVAAHDEKGRKQQAIIGGPQRATNVNNHWLRLASESAVAYWGGVDYDISLSYEDGAHLPDVGQTEVKASHHNDPTLAIHQAHLDGRHESPFIMCQVSRREQVKLHKYIRVALKGWAWGKDIIAGCPKPMQMQKFLEDKGVVRNFTKKANSNRYSMNHFMLCRDLRPMTTFDIRLLRPKVDRFTPTYHFRKGDPQGRLYEDNMA